MSPSRFHLTQSCPSELYAPRTVGKHELHSSTFGFTAFTAARISRMWLVMTSARKSRQRFSNPPSASALKRSAGQFATAWPTAFSNALRHVGQQQ